MVTIEARVPHDDRSRVSCDLMRLNEGQHAWKEYVKLSLSNERCILQYVSLSRVLNREKNR